MGLFDSWGSFASGIASGAADLGSWVGEHIGTVVGVAQGINDLVNPTKVQDGKAGPNSASNSATVLPNWYVQPTAAGSAKAAEVEGSMVGTLMLFTTALVVVVLIAKRA